MKIGTVFDATVRDLTSEGQAVVSAPNGCTVFVSGLWIGERGRVRVTGMKGRVGFAELIEVVESVPNRRNPPCEFHGVSGDKCGACAWMFVDYETQLEAKQARVVSAMQRLDASIQVNNIWPSHQEFGYRNRTQLKTDNKKLGFVAAKSMNLVDVSDCLVLSEANRFSLKKLREKLPDPAWSPKTKNKWTTLDVDEQTTAAQVSVNKRLGFQQANSHQNTRMRKWVAEKVSLLSNKDYAVELFCGSGNFTEILSESGFEKVIAVEGQVSSVQVLTLRQLQNVEAQVVNLFDDDVFSQFMRQHQAAHFMLLDPPRDGLKSRAGLLTKKSKLKDVLYISCDLATFTRDLKYFLNEGFKVQELQTLDLFPQTPHVELLCHLSR